MAGTLAYALGQGQCQWFLEGRQAARSFYSSCHQDAAVQPSETVTASPDEHCGPPLTNDRGVSGKLSFVPFLDLTGQI